MAATAGPPPSSQECKLEIGPATRLHGQIGQCHAEEMAVQDAIYWLGEAMRRGRIDCDEYLRRVRDLSRKQFYLHLTIQEARAKAGL